MATLAQITMFALLISLTQSSNAPSRRTERKDRQTTQAPNAQSDLKMITIGHGKLRNGHTVGFRIYEGPDGSDGEVTYATFSSIQDAQQQFEEWSKAAERITSQEQNTKRGRKAIDDRIVGSRTLIPKDPAKTPKGTEFLIIRRDTLNCYLIQSMSLATALKIEELMD